MVKTEETHDIARVLLIEDDGTDILAFKRAIRKSEQPFDLVIAEDAEEAIKLISAQNFTCVFLDYLLPDSDGLELLRKLRSKGIQTPVVVVTSQGNEQIAVEMMKSGALDYIVKEELTTERVVSLVHAASMLRRSEQEKDRVAATLRENQKLLGNIFDSSSVGMLLLNERGIVLRANKAFGEIAARSIEQILNHPFDEIFSPQLSIADLLHNRERFYEFSTQVNGETKHLSVTCNSFQDEPGSYYLIINFYDITSKVAYEKQIVWQNMRMDAILESTNSLIFSVDPNLTITGLNKATKKVFKTFYDIELEEGKNITQIPFDDDNRRMMEEGFKTAFAGKRTTVVHKVGRLYFETTFNPIKYEEKRIMGVSVFSQDITKEKNNEQGLIDAKKEAEELAKAKSQFLSNMSHEIRTPMNAIIGLTNLLLEDKLTDQQRENLSTLKFSADNLLVIINDILDLSKIESGKITFEEISLSCDKIIDQVAKTFSFQLKNKNVELITEIAPNIPTLLGDPYRLTQILNNLVGNAVKFTPEGKVVVSARFTGKVEAGKAEIEFKVADTGIGIQKNKLDTIFESFTQAYTDTTRKFGGTGLGLAITKQLIEVQGGHISVDSEPKNGTTFTFTIPFRTGGTAFNYADGASSVPDSALEGLKVAVAEDNKANQLVIRQILSRWKIQVIILNNGREAIDYLEHETPDVVFMDLQMPELSGFDAIEIIRNPDSAVLNHDVPVLALTADVFPETRDRIFDSGMNDYLLKPVNIDELKEKLIRYGILKEATGV